ncbi:MAG: hypothetical protein ACI802_003741, partial [Candidatus Paceibacteria bacterium]
DDLAWIERCSCCRSNDACFTTAWRSDDLCITRWIKSGLRDILTFFIAFVMGTGAGGIVCWYYNFPLGFSILGGIVVLGLALALVSDSMFS